MSFRNMAVGQKSVPRRTCEMSATLPVPCLCGYRGSIGENDLVWVRLTQKECEEGEPNPKTIDGRRLTRRKKSWVNPTEHLTTGVNPGKHLIYCKTTFKSCLIDIFLFPMEILNESAES